jgi:hypothetical protein
MTADAVEDGASNTAPLLRVCPAAFTAEYQTGPSKAPASEYLQGQQDS